MVKSKFYNLDTDTTLSSNSDYYVPSEKAIKAYVDNKDLSAGTGIDITNKIVSNSGVREISTGTTNGTISVNTGGTSAEVSVYGLGSAAYTDSTDYASSDIEDLIPAQASSSNQLADKDFVNSSIATNTANFIGTFTDITSLEAYSGTVTNNDYAFVTNSIIKDNGNDWTSFSDLDNYDKSLLTNLDYAWIINGTKFNLYRFDIIDQEWVLRLSDIEDKSTVTLNDAYNRYKAVINESTVTWDYEYTLNNSSFTADQWAAINSGITSGDVALIATALQPNDNISELNNNVGYITGITSSDVTTALGYTPQNTITGAATTITSNNLTASKALISDSNGKVATSSVTSTELGYVSGVTSAIQTQLNNKQNTLSAGTGIAISNANVISVTAPTLTNTTSATEALEIKGAGVDLDLGTADNAIAISGYRAFAEGSYSIAIGYDIDVTGLCAVAIVPHDYNNYITGNYSVTIGDESASYGNYSIAIGKNAYVDADYSIQLGKGTNTTAKTLAVGFGLDGSNNPIEYTLLDGTTGLIPDARISNNIARTSSIPTVNDATLTIQKNGTDVQTFTANASSDVIANIVVPTATSDLSNDSGFLTSADLPTNYVTTDTAQDITGTKTFVGQKKIGFKQSSSSDKLGFTLYNNSGTEKGYLEFNPTNTVDSVPLMTLGNYASATAGLTHVGFRKYSSISGANGAYNLLAPLVSDARTPFNLTTTYTNFYLPLGFTNGTTTITTAKSGLVDLSTLLPTVDQTYSGTSTNAQSGVAVKSAIDSAISSVYKAAGSVAFASRPTPGASYEGNVYNITDAFTTDSTFVEGSGISYPAGTNIVCINTSGTTYKWDVLAGFVDLSNYQQTSTAVTHTASTAVGSATQPVYIASDGTATATTYSLAKSVPSDAVFTDTTYSEFIGADGIDAGSIGLVPAPTATDNTKYLKGDGTWATVDSLPSQTGNAGKFLTTDGTDASWEDTITTTESSLKTIEGNSILGTGNISILPSQTSQSGKFLTTNGSIVSWATVDALPSQTSQSGKFLTTNGTTASWATVDVLPSQSGNSGKFLTTNGTTASWATISIPEVEAYTANEVETLWNSI